jgi:hypothetical protein
MQKMIVDRIEDALWNLSPGAIVKEDETWRHVKCRKDRANALAGKVDGLGCD